MSEKGSALIGWEASLLIPVFRITLKISRQTVLLVDLSNRATSSPTPMSAVEVMAVSNVATDRSLGKFAVTLETCHLTPEE